MDILYVYLFEDGDFGSGIRLHFDAFNGSGHKVQDGRVIMPWIKLGERAKAEINIDMSKFSIFSQSVKIII